MGTETGSNKRYQSYLTPQQVKLNNPQMGTETVAINAINHIYNRKLN